MNNLEKMTVNKKIREFQNIDLRAIGFSKITDESQTTQTGQYKLHALSTQSGQTPYQLVALMDTLINIQKDKWILKILFVLPKILNVVKIFAPKPIEAIIRLLTELRKLIESILEQANQTPTFTHPTQIIHGRRNKIIV